MADLDWTYQVVVEKTPCLCFNFLTINQTFCKFNTVCRRLWILFYFWFVATSAISFCIKLFSVSTHICTDDYKFFSPFLKVQRLQNYHSPVVDPVIQVTGTPNFYFWKYFYYEIMYALENLLKIYKACASPCIIRTVQKTLTFNPIRFVTLPYKSLYASIDGICPKLSVKSAGKK